MSENSQWKNHSNHKTKPIKSHHINNCRVATKQSADLEAPSAQTFRDPFASLWHANDATPTYNALKDSHTMSYFGTESTRKRIKQLFTQEINNRIRDCGTDENRNQEIFIQQHCKNIKKMLKKYSGIQNIKILPYCNGLRQSSKDNLTEFQKILKIKNNQKQQQHQNFLKSCWVNKRPDRPQIKLIRTLAPIQNYKIAHSLVSVKKCQTQQKQGRYDKEHQSQNLITHICSGVQSQRSEKQINRVRERSNHLKGIIRDYSNCHSLHNSRVNINLYSGQCAKSISIINNKMLIKRKHNKHSIGKSKHLFKEETEEIKDIDNGNYCQQHKGA